MGRGGGGEVRVAVGGGGIYREPPDVFFSLRPALDPRARAGGRRGQPSSRRMGQRSDFGGDAIALSAAEPGHCFD